MEGSLQPLKYKVGAVAYYNTVLFFSQLRDYPFLCLVEPFVVLEAGLGKGVAFLKEGLGTVGVELLVVLTHIVFGKVAFLGYKVD